MTLSNAMTAIETHCAAAAGTATTGMDVEIAHPVPKGKCIRIFYGGDGEVEEKLGAMSSLTHQFSGERVMVVAFWPLSTAGEDFAGLIEGELIALNAEIKTRLYGDSQLGGACDDLVIGDTVTDFVAVGGGHYRTLEIEVIPAFFDAYPIAR